MGGLGGGVGPFRGGVDIDGDGGDGDGGASFGGDGLVVSFMVLGIKEMRSCELFGFLVE